MRRDLGNGFWIFMSGLCLLVVAFLAYELHGKGLSSLCVCSPFAFFAVLFFFLSRFGPEGEK